MELLVENLHIPPGANLILGQSNFIKTVEDLYEILVGSAPGPFLYVCRVSIFSSGDSLLALKGRRSLMRYVGIAGLFAWLAVLFYNLTQDSFATPNIWINFGILAGMTAYALESDDKIPASGAVHGSGLRAKDVE